MGSDLPESLIFIYILSALPNLIVSSLVLAYMPFLSKDGEGMTHSLPQIVPLPS